MLWLRWKLVLLYVVEICNVKMPPVSLDGNREIGITEIVRDMGMPENAKNRHYVGLYQPLPHVTKVTYLKICHISKIKSA